MTTKRQINDSSESDLLHQKNGGQLAAIHDNA